MKSSVALKARMRKNWRDVSSEMYVRWRFVGSWVIWFWLARIISGSSQQDSTRRGVERGSVAIRGFIVDQPVSDGFTNQCRLARATIRLWAREDDQTHLLGVSQMAGKSMRVGRRIFNIVKG